MNCACVEDIILKYSTRGMDNLRTHLNYDFCQRAASALLEIERGPVLIATGFYVAGFAETDGPPGAFFLAKALNCLGFECTIVTDRFCRDFFDGINVEYVDIAASPEHCNTILNNYQPRALISIERCGVNSRGDYANMRGLSISKYTAQLDELFNEGRRRAIPTFGIGDGGNEIGMGNFRHVIERELGLIPCVTEVDYPIIASVSNWGGWGLCAYLSQLSGKAVMPDYDEIGKYLEHIVSLGSVDGVTKRHTPTVDGFSVEVERKIVEELIETISHAE